MGGIVEGVLGGGKETTTTNSTTTPILPSYLEEALRNNVIRIEDLVAALPQRQLAEMTPEELQAYQMIAESISGRPDVTDEAIGIQRQVADIGLGPLSQEQLDSYMNPYAQNVIDISKREISDDYAQKLQAEKANAASRGAFGGSRQSIIEEGLNESLGQSLSDIQYRGLADAFESAYNKAYTGAGLAGQAALGMQDLATSGQEYDIRGAQALEAAGQAQRGYQQQLLDLPLQQFEDALSASTGLSNILSQTGSIVSGQKSENVQTTEKENSPLSTALGIASMIAAPMTGGASLGLGLGSLGSMGSMIGSQFGADLLGNTLIGAGSQLGGPLPWMAKAGGLVPKAKKQGIAKYAEGGLVDYLFAGKDNPVMKYLMGVMAENPESEVRRDMTPQQKGEQFRKKVLGNATPEQIQTFMQEKEQTRNQSPLVQFLQGFTGDTGELPATLPEDGDFIDRGLTGASSAPEVTAPTEETKPTPKIVQETLAKAGVQSTAPTPPKESKVEQSALEAWLADPMTQIGARILSESFAPAGEAVGKALIGQQKSIEEAKQRQIENELDAIRTEAYRAQTELARDPIQTTVKLTELRSKLYQTIAEAVGLDQTVPQDKKQAIINQQFRAALRNTGLSSPSNDLQSLDPVNLRQ